VSDQLPILYQQMADITKPFCDAGCAQFKGNQYRCCEKKYCELARRFAREHYEIELEDTGHAIPFMGPRGCTVAPHLRPICTMHACPINYGPGVDVQTMNHYYALRSQLAAEAERQNKIPEHLRKEDI
jgi:hypothetical protein